MSLRSSPSGLPSAVCLPSAISVALRFASLGCLETDPAKLWRWYIQLTQAGAAFRTAKSDLKLRPIYHQKTERVEAHILVWLLRRAAAPFGLLLRRRLSRSARWQCGECSNNG